jgi:hypothetical protein
VISDGVRYLVRNQSAMHQSLTIQKKLEPIADPPYQARGFATRFAIHCVQRGALSFGLPYKCSIEQVSIPQGIMCVRSNLLAGVCTTLRQLHRLGTQTDDRLLAFDSTCGLLYSPALLAFPVVNRIRSFQRLGKGELSISHTDRRGVRHNI